MPKNKYMFSFVAAFIASIAISSAIIPALIPGHGSNVTFITPTDGQIIDSTGFWKRVGLEFQLTVYTDVEQIVVVFEDRLYSNYTLREGAIKDYYSYDLAVYGGTTFHGLWFDGADASVNSDNWVPAPQIISQLHDVHGNSLVGTTINFKLVKGMSVACLYEWTYVQYKVKVYFVGFGAPVIWTVNFKVHLVS